MQNNIFLKRRENLKKSLEENIVECIIINPLNIYYLTGFYAEGIDRLIALILSPDVDILIIPELHKNEVDGINNISIITWNDSEDPWQILKSKINLNGYIYYIEKNFPYYFYKLLFNDGATVKFIDNNLIKMRLVKDENEVNLIKKAIEVSENSLKDSLSEVTLGITEKQLANTIDGLIKSRYYADLAFTTIVSFGKNAANPHHIPDSTQLKKNECIVIDFGSRYNMYCSDMTRTFFYGNPDENFIKIYNTVKNAQEDGCNRASSSITGMELDRYVRNIIEKSGYGKNFIHRTGHGIGLNEHEEPYIDSKNQNKFIPGNVITIEPGIYIPNKYGVRLEDIVLIEDNGGINLNKFTHEMEIL